MSRAPKWIRVDNVRAFLAEQGTRNVGVHKMKMMKRMPWPYCTRCGLLALKNQATRRALDAACVTEE